MVYVPNSSGGSEKLMNEEEEPEVEIPLQGSEVHSSDRLPFVLDLIGANMEKSLQKAKEMGLTGDDLLFIESQDIDTLLETSLLRRKLTAVCQYLKDGGTLKHGMSMSEIYKGAEPKSPDDSSGFGNALQDDNGNAKPTETAVATANAGDQEHQEIDNAEEKRKNWIKGATAAFHKLPGQLRQLTRMKKQLQNMARQIKSLLNIS